MSIDVEITVDSQEVSNLSTSSECTLESPVAKELKYSARKKNRKASSVVLAMKENDEGA